MTCSVWPISIWPAAHAASLYVCPMQQMTVRLLLACLSDYTNTRKEARTAAAAAAKRRTLVWLVWLIALNSTRCCRRRPTTHAPLLAPIARAREKTSLSPPHAIHPYKESYTFRLGGPDQVRYRLSNIYTYASPYSIHIFLDSIYR